jgi:hypothetical protein
MECGNVSVCYRTNHFNKIILKKKREKAKTEREVTHAEKDRKKKRKNNNTVIHKTKKGAKRCFKHTRPHSTRRKPDRRGEGARATATKKKSVATNKRQVTEQQTSTRGN